LVDEALHILHSLSDTPTPGGTASSSHLAHYTNKLLHFLKSLSLIQYTSQEEPLSTHDPRAESVKKAMHLLSKAAEADNPDALFLLGELNFVYLLHPPPSASLQRSADEANDSSEITQSQIIERPFAG
jgi:hypothetical protein